MVGVRGRKPLESPVALAQIARVQWDLFPALRRLEEEHGDPLYYPFAMGSPDETHTLPGRFFKLPSLLVDQFAPLALVARESRAGAGSRTAARHVGSWWEAIEGLVTERPREAPRPR